MSTFKNILVTGGAGFIGSFLVDRLIKLAYNVTILDNLEDQVHQGQKPEYLNSQARFIKGDVRDYNVFKSALKNQDVVFHLAASVGVSQSNYEITRYSEVNVTGTANLLDIIINHRNIKIKKILAPSSMTAFGEGQYKCTTHGIVEPPLRDFKQMKKKDWFIYCPKCSNRVTPVATDETASQPCNSIYALTKKAQEDMLHLIGPMYDLPVTTLRCFNVYGPRQSLSNPYTGVTAIFISRLKNNQAPVVYEDGLQSRDFISVHDVVNAFIQAMKSQKANYQIFNIASGKPTSIKDIAEILARLMKVNIKPQISLKPRKNDIRHCFANIQKAKKILKWSPKVTLGQGLKELITWSQTQMAQDDFARVTKELKQKGII